MIVIYALAKYLAYSMWCYVGVRLVQPVAANLATAGRFGATRWLIGLAVGLAVFFFVGPINEADAARTYFVVYTPLRAIERTIMALLISHKALEGSRPVAKVSLPLWCAGGMVVSFLTDLLSPEGLQGRFCIGRCLC